MANREKKGPSAQAQRESGKLPLVKCAHPANSGEEPTPERLAEVLLEQELEVARDLVPSRV